MAEGLAVELPLAVSDRDGAYALIKNFEAMAEQNLKMVILTDPGERIMQSDFGVGIRRLLFEQNTPDTIHTIQRRIISQVSKYLPYIDLGDVQVFSPTPQYGLPTDIDKTRVVVKINYSVPSVGVSSDFTLPVEI